jgi:cation:H+ antiporter|tara:strand:- start:8048 stop:9058 length:1011 start_codon:yes stop_codon:yes gene_type:complete
VHVLIDFLWVLLGLMLLYLGGEWLVKGARGISLKMGIAPLVVGLTVVAFGTSAPELLVSLQANFKGKGDMALGNVVGSNICNIALILGVGAIIRPMLVHPQILKREMPILLTISAVFLWLLRDNEIGQVEGLILFAGVITYTWFSLWQARRTPQTLARDALPDDKVEAAPTKREGRILYDVGFVLLGMAALVYGADRLVFGGSSIARIFGVSEATIALTVVAFGTSLPELATSVVAALRRQGAIIIGNVVGSCLFNILCVVGLTATVSPLTRTPALQDWDLWVMLALTVLLFPFLWRRGTLARGEGAFLLAVYASYVCYLVFRPISFENILRFLLR